MTPFGRKLRGAVLGSLGAALIFGLLGPWTDVRSPLVAEALAIGANSSLHAASGSKVRHGPGYPTITSVKRFRRKMGLDLDLVGQTDAINARARFLVESWLAGKMFSRRTARQWGSPLRAVDVQELVFRKKYVAQALTVIPEWAAGNAVSTYAGIYVNERKGGFVEVGFSGDQGSQISAMLGDTALLAPGRVRGLPRSPVYSLVELDGLRSAIDTEGWQIHGVDAIMSLSIDVRENHVWLITRHVAPVTRLAMEAFGSDAPITVSSPAERRLTPR